MECLPTSNIEGIFTYPADKFQYTIEHSDHPPPASQSEHITIEPILMCSDPSESGPKSWRDVEGAVSS